MKALIKIIIIVMALMLIGSILTYKAEALNSWSYDQTQYYYNGSVYIGDLLGTSPLCQNGTTINSEGQEWSTDCALGKFTPTTAGCYSNTTDPFGDNTYKWRCVAEGGANHAIKFPFGSSGIANASWRGVVHMAVKRTDTTLSDFLVEVREADSNECAGFGMRPGKTGNYYCGCTGSTSCTTLIAFQLDEWVQFMMNNTGTDMYLYVKDSLNNWTLIDTKGSYEGMGPVTIGVYTDAEVEFSNFFMTVNGTIPQGIPIVPLTATFQNPTPLNGSANNSLTPDIKINVSCTGTGNSTIQFRKGDTNFNSSDIVSKIIYNASNPDSFYTLWTLNNSIVDEESIYYYKGSCGISSINTTDRVWYFDTTPPNIEVLQNLTSTSLTVNLTQYFNVTDIFSGVDICELNFTYITTGTSSLVNCTDTVLFSNVGLYDFILNATDKASNKNSLTGNFTIDQLNYVYFVDNKTGLPLVGDNVTLIYPSSTISNLVTDSEGKVNFSSIVNSVLEIGNYSYTFLDLPGFQTPVTFYDILNYTDLPVNQTYSIFRASILINIYDREKNELIDWENVTIQIVNFATFVTENGTVFIENTTIIPGTYSVITEADNYITEKQTFTFTNQEVISLDIYMVNATSTGIGNLIVQVYDNFYNFQIGANTVLLEFKVDSDSFVEVSQCETNTNGECIFSVELGTKFYIVQASAEIGGILYQQQSTTNGEIIKLDNTVIELHLQTFKTFELGSLFNLQIQPTNTSLIGNTSYLTAQFQDLSGLDHTVCIEYFALVNNNKVSLDSPTCVTGSSGIVNVGGGFILDRDFTNIAQIYALENNLKTVYAEYSYPALEGSFASNFSLYLKPMLLFLTLALLAFSIYLKNIQIFAYGTIPLALSSLTIAPGLLGALSVTTIVILDLVIIYLSKRKSEEF